MKFVRIPSWLLSVPFEYPISALAVFFAGIEAYTWTQGGFVTSKSIENTLWPPIVIAWIIALGIGGILILYSVPAKHEHTEGAGLTLLWAGLLIYMAANFATGNYLTGGLAGALMLGSLLRLTTVVVSLRASARARGSDHE